MFRKDRLLGAPPWLDADHFDITAKIANPKSYTLAGFEAIQQPMQRLLADQFKLALRDAIQPITVYALVPNGRPKLSPSTTTDRPGCKPSAGNGVRIITCQATSMAALAEALPNMAPAYFTHPVVDRTGLTAAYNFSIAWSPLGRVRQDSSAAPSGGGHAGPS